MLTLLSKHLLLAKWSLDLCWVGPSETGWSYKGLPMKPSQAQNEFTFLWAHPLQEGPEQRSETAEEAGLQLKPSPFIRPAETWTSFRGDSVWWSLSVVLLPSVCDPAPGGFPHGGFNRTPGVVRVVLFTNLSPLY